MFALRNALERFRAVASSPGNGTRRGFVGQLSRLAPFAGVGVALAFFLAVREYTDFRTAYEFDPDEGNNVIKALLLARGDRFGTGIWSDQPPGFSYLLWAVFRIFGWQVVYGRVLVVGFSALLLGIVYDSLRRSSGHLAAFSAVLLLLCSQNYVELSVSIMLGLPAIALTTVAVWGLLGFRDSGRLGWLVASGAAMGAALATKLFVAFIVPVCALTLLVWGWQQGRHKRALRDTAVWTLSVALVAAVGLGPVLFSNDPASLYRAHRLASEVGTPMVPMLGANMVPRFIKEDTGLFLLALLGACQGLLQRRALTTLAGLWVFAGFIAMSRHYPVWTHHRLLLTVPAALLAGAAVPSLFASVTAGAERAGVPGWLQTKLPRILAASVPVLVIVALQLHSPQRFQRMLKPPAWTHRERDLSVENVLKKYKSETHFMVTARQMYAFRTGIPIPPELAITSAKRFFSGLLDAQSIIREIDHYHPEQVILTARWPGAVRLALRRYLQPAYVRVFQDNRNQNVEVYVIRALAEAHGVAPPDAAPAESEAEEPQDDEGDSVDNPALQ